LTDKFNAQRGAWGRVRKLRLLFPTSGGENGQESEQDHFSRVSLDLAEKWQYVILKITNRYIQSKRMREHWLSNAIVLKTSTKIHQVKRYNDSIPFTYNHAVYEEAHYEEKEEHV
jgi:hypothetical protein